MQPRAMQHDPKIVYLDAQQLADLFALQTIYFAQRESTGGALRQRGKTFVENFPEVAALDQLGGRCVPFIRRIVVVPVTLPRLRTFEELAMVRAFFILFAERSFTHGAAKMID